MSRINTQSLIQSHRDIKEKLIHTMLILESGATMMMLGLSIFRASEIGLATRDVVQIALVLVLLTVTLSRQHLPFKIKAIFLISFNIVVHMVGFLSLGPYAGSVFFLPLALFALTLIFTRKWLYLFLVATAIYLAIVVYLFCNQLLILPSNIDSLLTNLPHWMVYSFSMLLLLSVSGISLFNYRENTHDLIEKVIQQRDQLKWHAHHDELTRILNYRALQEEVTAYNKKNTHCAVLFLDLDGFKQVNDQYGHDAGDICLREVANRLVQITGDYRQCCRLGGDEFIVITTAMHNIEFLAEAIIEQVKQPITFHEHYLQVGVSIGIAIANAPPIDLEQARTVADHAMYEAKKQGKGAYVISYMS